MIKKELNKLVEEMHFFKYKPKDNHELFAGWKDDGIRDHEIDWGEPKGKELPW